MNAFLILGTLSLCVLIFALVVAAVASFGVPVPVALALVYVSVIVWMKGMQRRAGGVCEQPERRRFDDRQASGPATAQASAAPPFATEQRTGLGDLLHQP